MKNINSHLTVKERTKLSFPTQFLLDNQYLKGKILDFGCGLGFDVDYLKSKNFDIIGYDKYYFKTYPQEKFDTIICHYVLNVLLPEEQTIVLMEISQLLKPTGKAYFSVRRDVKKNSFIYNPKRKIEVYQCNVNLPFLSIFNNKYCEIYEYQTYQLVHKNQNKTCNFCNINQEIICENVNFYAIFDTSSTTKGHILVICKAHIKDYFELNTKQQTSLWLMVSFLKNYLQKKLNCVGFNINFDTFEVSNENFSHAHIHIIPLYKDTK